ncbi:MAG: hypothetical protein K6A72_09050 [Lachnospiraceae bacterium]|nr:hypothetical protein [Lachnospiraceae bacterium]
MATRPVFVATFDRNHFVRENVEFEFFSGFSDSQKRKCIDSLHQAYLEHNPGKKILEISSKSALELGVKLSAFNLKISTKNGRVFSVESAFQASKVFEQGGPYVDLLDASSRDAKTDERLINSGNIVGFRFFGKDFDTEPKTFFYNWLYIHALHLNDELSESIMDYDVFSDIVFNPKKSINCQAEAAAIFVSLKKQGLLEKAMENKEEFKRIVYPDFIGKMEQLSFI